MKYIKLFEDYNVQDMMSIQTSITKNIDDALMYEEMLKPYYDYIRKLEHSKNLSPITFENDEHIIGFSFTFLSNVYFIFVDKNENKIYIDIGSSESIPLMKPIDIYKALNLKK